MGCGGQFKAKHFGFGCSDDERELFCKTQCSTSRTVYMIYRLLMWTYQFGWFLAYYIHTGVSNPNQLSIGYRFLTRWGYIINVIYFTLAFIYSIIGFVRRHEKMIFHESLSMLMLRSTTWMLHSVGQAAALLIVILYWGLVADSSTVATAFNVDSHGINLVLYLIEIFVVAFPMRLLHFIYPVIFGCVYAIATVLMHVAGDVSAVYEVLDWANRPGTAAGIGVGIAFGGCILGHCVMFGLYQLRIFISGKCCSSPSSAVTLRSSVNPAYVIDST